jgi:hypothetical protein
VIAIAVEILGIVAAVELTVAISVRPAGPVFEEYPAVGVQDPVAIAVAAGAIVIAAVPDV